ncbi:MAG TPA: hypothetical protein VK524_28410 [Polyangiaceae bacterium]|nr:hypothetical protein [Polyangiaceae bacterium]
MTIESIRTTARRLAEDRKGAAITEYLIIVGLVALVCIMAYQTFGSTVDQKIRGQTQRLNLIQ